MAEQSKVNNPFVEWETYLNPKIVNPTSEIMRLSYFFYLNLSEFHSQFEAEFPHFKNKIWTKALNSLVSYLLGGALDAFLTNEKLSYSFSESGQQLLVNRYKDKMNVSSFITNYITSLGRLGKLINNSLTPDAESRDLASFKMDRMLSTIDSFLPHTPYETDASYKMPKLRAFVTHILVMYEGISAVTLLLNTKVDLSSKKRDACIIDVDAIMSGTFLSSVPLTSEILAASFSTETFLGYPSLNVIIQFLEKRSFRAKLLTEREILEEEEEDETVDNIVF